MNSDSRNTLLVVTGSTGAGKTAVAINLAKQLGCDIINADSRQIYRGIPIGTAAPTPQQLAEVKHHFVACKELAEPYSAAQFEEDVMALLPSLWRQSRIAVLCGGSMLYVHAVCNGIDPVPDVPAQVREQVKSDLREKGLAALLQELSERDPKYFAIVDRNNHQRVVHALEICRHTGHTFSSFRTGTAKSRPFRIIKIGLELDRAELYARINSRVDSMIAQGLVDEARRVYPLRHLNALNTVGYKELFQYFDGQTDLRTAVERIKKHTRVYAKKQLTWHKRDEAIVWCHPQVAESKAIELLGS